MSGIIPVHNEEAVLGQVLDAISDQTRKVDELVVVLDRCSDGSGEIAKGRCDRMLEVDAGNTAAAIRAGVQHCRHEILVLFDGNTLIPHDYVARLIEALAESSADLVEWHGGLMALPVSTIERFGSFSDRHLWTLEYFLRVSARGGKVLRLDGPHVRLKPSPLRRNLRYGLDYADLSEQYGIAPYFRIGTKSGLLPDSVAAIGAVLGHARNARLVSSFVRLRAFLRSD